MKVNSLVAFFSDLVAGNPKKVERKNATRKVAPSVPFIDELCDENVSDVCATEDDDSYSALNILGQYTKRPTLVLAPFHSDMKVAINFFVEAAVSRRQCFAR